VNLSLLQGIAGSEPGAGHAKGAAQKADFASAAGAFRALVDVLANGAGSADGAASTDDSGRASSDDAFANLTDGNSPVDSSDAATDSTAASVHAAIVAAWTVAPSSSDDDAAANDGPHGRDEHAEAPRGADTPAKDESSVVAVVSAFVPDLPGPVAKAATAAGTSNGAANQRGGADEGALAGARTNTDVISDLTMALTDE
jgi:hypothetical protein